MKPVHSLHPASSLFTQLKILNSQRSLASTSTLTPLLSVQASNFPKREQVESTYPASTWQRSAYADFESRLLAKSRPFPCIYSTLGHRSNQHRFLFLNSADPSSPSSIGLIGPALTTYLANADSYGPLTSLVVFSAPSSPKTPLETYAYNHWSFLRALRAWDPAPWPAHIPEEVEDPRWQFYFGGEAVLPISLHPAYERRRSRAMATHVLVLQPWRLLAQLVSTPERAAAASGKVRALLKGYDDIAVCPDLQPWQDGSAVESHMLCLLDVNETARCPWPTLL